LADNRGIDHMPAIDRADHAVHPQLTLIDRDFRDLGIEAADVIDGRDASKPSSRKRLAPTRPFSSKVEDTEQPLVIRQEPAAKLNRVFAAGCSQFVDKAFDEKAILRVPDRAPITHRYMRSGGMIVHLYVRN